MITESKFIREGMFMREIIFPLLFAILILASVTKTQAQEPPSLEKAALIKELNELTGVHDNVKAIMNSVANQVRQDRQRVFERTINELGFLSEKEREDLIKQENEDSIKLNERVMRMFNEKVDLNKIADEVSLEVYDKYYTVDEIKDLITFYKSATGQKTVKVMPQVFADSMAKTGEKLLPQIEPIINQIMEEEKERLNKMIPPKPQRKKAQRRRR